MSGFGVAYDAAVRTLLAQERALDRRSAKHQFRRDRWRNQAMLNINKREHLLEQLKVIEDQLSESAHRYSERRCPECDKPFVLVKAVGIEIDACVSCGSFWFDDGELKVLTHRAADIQTIEGPVEKSEYCCPVCGKTMQQHRFLTHNDLLVDKCPDDHGVYLERDELRRSIEL